MTINEDEFVNHSIRSGILKLWPVCVLTGFFLLLSPVVMSQDDIPDNEACLDCHEEYDLSLASTPHRLSEEISGPSIEIACVSCHSGAEVHVEDPGIGNISNPSRLDGFEAIQVCGTCHTAHRELDNYGFDAHSTMSLNCSDCHRVHNAEKSLLLDDRAEFCFPCHETVRADFNRTSSHPVAENSLTCLNCHQFAKRGGHYASYDLGRVCQECHPDQGGPHLYEHEAVNGYSVEGGGCVECHNPHGSENDRLLKQPGNLVCGQCHTGHVTRNHGNLWDQVWSKLDCQVCHTDTHGSFVSELYLDPDLPTKFAGDCYSTGCHSANGGAR